MTYTDTLKEFDVAMINKLQSGQLGGFAAALGEAYQLADLNNRKKLRLAFPKVFDMAWDLAALELLDA